MEKQLVKINRKVLSKEKEINLYLDFIVPDVKPDIVAIIDTNAGTYIYNEEISSGKIRLDGNVDSRVIYLSDSGETKSLAVSLDFSEVIEDEQITSDLRFYSFIELLNIETRIVNERKVSVSATAKLYVSFYEAKEIELISSLDDLENIEVKEEKCKIKNLIGANKAKSSIKEVIECNSAESISDILSFNVQVKNNENKVSINKVLSKADCNIKIVYQTENSEVKEKEVVYPIMSFIDLEGVKENNIIETTTNLRNMQVFLVQNETNKISINLEFETSLQVYESKEISLIDDVYSLSKNLDFTKKEFEAELDSEFVKNVFNIVEEFELEDVNEILDSRANFRIVSKERIGSYVSYNLEVTLKVMYKLDSRNGLAVKNMSYNTVAKIEEGENDETIFSITKESYNLNSDMVSCNIEITAEIRKNSLKTISVLDDITEGENAEKPEYSMVVYFVKPKDTIWKIAKNFKVSMQSIIDSNNLENPDKINIGDRLYIVR